MQTDPIYESIAYGMLGSLVIMIAAALIMAGTQKVIKFCAEGRERLARYNATHPTVSQPVALKHARFNRQRHARQSAKIAA